MLVFLAKVVRAAPGRSGKRALDHRKLLANADVVPVAVVFAQVAKTLVGIEQQIFIPDIGDSFHLDTAPLEPDDLIVCAAQLAARPERNERLGNAGSGCELL